MRSWCRVRARDGRCATRATRTGASRRDRSIDRRRARVRGRVDSTGLGFPSHRASSSSIRGVAITVERRWRTDAEDDSGTRPAMGGGGDGVGHPGAMVPPPMAPGPPGPPMRRGRRGRDPGTGTTEGVSCDASAVSTADGTDGASNDAWDDATTRWRWGGGDGDGAAGIRAPAPAPRPSPSPRPCHVAPARRAGGSTSRIDPSQIPRPQYVSHEDKVTYNTRSEMDQATNPPSSVLGVIRVAIWDPPIPRYLRSTIGSVPNSGRLALDERHAAEHHDSSTRATASGGSADFRHR